MREGWEDTILGAFITQSKKKVKVLHGDVYPAVGVMMEGRGFVTREPFIGGKTTYKQLTPIEPNQLVLRSITAWEAPIQVTTDDHVGFHVSGVFPVFDIDSAKINPRFLGLHCQYNPFWESMRERTVGSVLRRKTLSAKALMEIPIELPPLPEQKRVVDLLSTVDSYIETLRQQLESAKRSRSAVLHELLTAGRDGWAETTLGGIADFINGYPFKPEHLGQTGLPVIRIKQLLDPNEPVDRTEVETPDRCILRDGDIVFSWSGTLAVRIWNRGPAKLNQHLFKVIEKEGAVKGLVSLILDHAIQELEEKSHGTTMKHVTKQTLLPHKVALPPLTEQERIVDLVSTVDSYIDALEGQISSSTSLRSGLLSDLLSGNHEIPSSYDQLIGAA